MTIDLNADLGEGAGSDELILPLVSSASIACGFHAGTPASVFASIRAAHGRGVAIGAHPSFDDRRNFGRLEMQIPAHDLFTLLIYQLGAFRTLCRSAGVELNHIKPHGALYNMAARDPGIAETVAEALLAVDAGVLLFAPAASALARAGDELKLRVVSEVFADRNYNADGSLVSRQHPNALLHDPGEAAERVLRILQEKKVRALDGAEIDISAETVCVHGDTPGAVEFVRILRTDLENAGIIIAAPRRSK